MNTSSNFKTAKPADIYAELFGKFSLVQNRVRSHAMAVMAANDDERLRIHLFDVSKALHAEADLLGECIEQLPKPDLDGTTV